jgi:hypothetical protein
MLMNRLEVGTDHRLKLEGTKSTRELNRRAVPASKRSQSTFQSAEDLEDKIKPSVVSGQ